MLTMDHASQSLLGGVFLVVSMDTQTRQLNICIVSRKNIYRNTRVVRQAGALSDAGHNVTVVCFTKPHEELLAQVPRVRFVEVPPVEINRTSLRRIHPYLDMEVLAAVPPMRNSLDLLESFLIWRIKKAEERGSALGGVGPASSAARSSFSGRWAGRGRIPISRSWQRFKRELKISIYEGVQRLPGGSAAWEVYRWGKRIVLSPDSAADPNARSASSSIGPQFDGPAPMCPAPISIRPARTRHAHVSGTRVITSVLSRTADAIPALGLHVPLAGLTRSLDRLALSVLERKQRSEIALVRDRLNKAGEQHPCARLDAAVDALAALDPAAYDRVLGLVENTILLDAGFSVLALEKFGEVKFDFVQSHDYTSLLSAEMIRRHRGGELVYDAVEIAEHRAVADEHIDVDRATKDEIFRRIEASIFLKSSGLLTVGEKLSEWYADTYEIEPPCVLRNCRYLSPSCADHRLRRDCGISQKDPLLLWFGGGYPKQGMSFAIEILAKMRKDVHLAMLTEFMPQWEWYEEELRALIKAEGLESRVHFLPLRSPNELLTYASSASVGLIPRPKDDVLNVEYSLPNKLFEMIMSRTPIAATDLPNVQQIIRQYGIGCTLIDGDAEASAEALHALLDDVAEGKLAPRLEAAARDLCWEKESQRLVAFYAELSGCSAVAASPREAARPCETSRTRPRPSSRTEPKEKVQDLQRS